MCSLATAPWRLCSFAIRLYMRIALVCSVFVAIGAGKELFAAYFLALCVACFFHRINDDSRRRRPQQAGGSTVAAIATGIPVYLVCSLLLASAAIVMGLPRHHTNLMCGGGGAHDARRGA